MTCVVVALEVHVLLLQIAQVAKPLARTANCFLFALFDSLYSETKHW